MNKRLKIGLLTGIPLLIIAVVVVVWISDNYSYGNSKVYQLNESLNQDSLALVAPQEFSLGGSAGSGSTKKIEDQARTQSPESNITPTQERFIIKTGRLSMVVGDVKQSAGSISEYAISNGGFVVSSNVTKTGLSLYGEVVIRVPVTVFDKAQEDIKAMGEVTSQYVTGQDVTEEYVDMDAQMRNLKATEQQFLEIMQRATRIEDVLAVQRELTWVRAEIERIEGRMKYLRQSAELSTLTVYLSTDPNALPVLDAQDTWKPIAEAKQALRSLVDFGKVVVNVLIWLVVYIPLWIVIGLVIWLVVRRMSRMKNSA